MLTDILKQFVPGAKMRHFSTLVICNKSRIQMKVKHSWTEMKYLRPTKPKLIACRWYNTESEQKPIHLPALMDRPIIKSYSVLKALLYGIQAQTKLKWKIDPNFDMVEFDVGVRKAMRVISIALANEDYETLYDTVENETIEILKEKVSRLTHQQRQLIAIDPDDMLITIPYALDCKEKGEDVWVVEICYLGFYTPDVWKQDILQSSNLMDVFQSAANDRILQSNYTFERTYKNGIGGPWIATTVNHFSLCMN